MPLSRKLQVRAHRFHNHSATPTSNPSHKSNRCVDFFEVLSRRMAPPSVSILDSQAVGKAGCRRMSAENGEKSGASKGTVPPKRGFSLSFGKSRKREVVNAAVVDEAPARERMHGIENGVVQSSGGKKKKEPIVIKLVQNPWVDKPATPANDAADSAGTGGDATGAGEGGGSDDATGPKKPLTLEEEAEAELLARMRQAHAAATGAGDQVFVSKQPNLVISLDSQSAVPKAGASGSGSGRAPSGTSADDQTGAGSGSGSGSGGTSSHRGRGGGRRGRHGRSHDDSLKSKLFCHTRSLQVDDKDGKGGPMLLRNRVPGITELENDSHKLKHDLSFRPDELTIRSEAYERIPIEEFGAAMLRGMGVTDINSGAAFMHDKRSRGLGLGAEEDPVAALKRANKHAGAGGRRKRIPRPGEATSKKKVIPESKKYPGLRRGVVVRITVGRRSGQLGIAVQVEGVPGLERMRVRVSETEVISIQKKTAVVAKASSLTPEQVEHMSRLAKAESAARAEEKRLEREQVAKEEAERRAAEEKAAEAIRAEKRAKREQKDKERKDRGDRGDRGRDGDRSRRKRSRSRDRDSHRDRDGRSKKQRVGDAAPSRERKPARNWVVPGIRVRVVSKSVAKGRYYLKKGVVMDVPEPCVANLRMDTGQLVEAVAQRRLETVLPKSHAEVVVVSGDRSLVGQRGRVVGKDKRAQTAAVQILGTGDVETLKLDDISEFAGRDDHM